MKSFAFSTISALGLFAHSAQAAPTAPAPSGIAFGTLGIRQQYNATTDEGCLNKDFQWVTDGSCDVFTATWVKPGQSAITKFANSAGGLCGGGGADGSNMDCNAAAAIEFIGKPVSDRVIFGPGAALNGFWTEGVPDPKEPCERAHVRYDWQNDNGHAVFPWKGFKLFGVVAVWHQAVGLVGDVEEATPTAPFESEGVCTGTPVFIKPTPTA